LTHDALVARNGAWERVIKTVKLLVNEGIDTSIGFALARFNIGEFPKVLKLAESLGVNSMFVNNIVPIGRAYQNWDQLSPSTSQLARFRRFIGNEHCRYLRSKRRLVLDFDIIKSLRSCIGCGACACVISPAGEVRIADVFPIVVGNLLKEEPMAVWKRINQTWADPFIAEFIHRELRNVLDLRKIKDLQDHYKIAKYALG
jgi:MoaA/NifB/PqqE/SkfB family radical SAM enzyme